MAEWLNAPVLKTDVGESLPWVRIPPPPPIISFLLICLKISAFRANILYRTTYFTTYSDNFFAEIFEIKNYITYGKPRLENGRYVVDATIPFEMREKLGWGKQKRLYLKTNNYEQAVANLADKKVELEKLATDMLAEFDPLVSKAEELLELLVIRYEKNRFTEQYERAEKDKWYWDKFPIGLEDLKAFRHRSSDEQIEEYTRLLRILRTETLKVLEYSQSVDQDFSEIDDFGEQIIGSIKAKNSLKAFEIKELKDILADELKAKYQQDAKPYYHEWGMVAELDRVKRKLRKEGKKLDDEKLDDFARKILGLDNHQIQRFKDIERTYNEFIDKHEEKVKGRSTQGIRFSDLQKLWEASELDSSNNLRNKTLGQYKLGQNDFIEKFGNIDLATLNTKETCRRFITYLHKEYHKQIGKEPLANGTIKNKKSGVSVLLDYAVDSPDIKIDVNAWKGVAVSAKIGRELKPTMAWSREMLEALFSMPMDTNHKLIFRIANILGCRLEEASSLQWGDIRKHNGVLCVDLTRESLLVKSNRNIKGQSSARRLIPIVPILEHYLKEHKKNFKKPYENKQLTGGWAKDKDGKVSGSVSKKLNRKYVKKVVPQDSVYTYNIHSFRNTLLDNCAKVGIDPVVANELVGHSKKEMRKHYRYPPFWEDKDKLKEVYKKLSTIDYSYTKGGKE